MSSGLYAAYQRQERLRLKRHRSENREYTRSTRQKTSQTQNILSLIFQVTDENVELSMRLNLAVELREKMFRLYVDEVVELMRTQHPLVMKLANAVLRTAYVPLQQLFFMSLTSLLSTLNSGRSEQTAIVRERFCDNIGHLDAVLLIALSVDDVVGVIDPGKALWVREQVNALNRSTKVCRTYIVRKCWISSCGKDKMMPTTVDKWLDFGETMLTFYHQLPLETILYNIPYTCLETLEFDETITLALIFVQQVIDLAGINLIAFVVDSTDFTEFKDTLCSMKPEGVKILSTPDLERHRVVANERTQPLSPITHKTIPTPPTISPVAKPDEPDPKRTRSLPTRLVSLPGGIGLQTNLRSADTLQPRNRRASEETTQITEWQQRAPETSMEVASLNDQGLVLRSVTNSQPVRQSSAASLEVVTTRFTLSHISRNLAFWNRLRGLLQALTNGLPRRPILLDSGFTSPTNDLTRAKAECLRDLRESMGYVEPESITVVHLSYWLMLVIAILIIIPWVIQLAH